MNNLAQAAKVNTNYNNPKKVINDIYVGLKFFIATPKGDFQIVVKNMEYSIFWGDLYITYYKISHQFNTKKECDSSINDFLKIIEKYY